MFESIKFVFSNLPLLIKGAGVAIEVTLVSIFIGLVLGVMVAALRIYGSKTIKKVVYLYEWVLRGTPILVLIFIIFFGLPTIKLNFGPFVSVVLALGLRSSAYQSQIYRGAILSIGNEQMEAGLSLGLSKFKSLYYIILPQAVRLSLPGFTNEFTIVLKDSSLAYVVGIAEILKYGRNIIVQSFRPFEIYLACAVLYFVLFHFFYYLFKYIASRYQVPGFIIKS